MPTFVLPDTVHGGTVTVQGNSLADAQSNAASQTGVSLAQQQGAGTFGVNTNDSLSGGSAGSSTGGAGNGGLPQGPQTGGDSISALLNALASGNKQAFDEQVKEFNQTFGLDQRKFQESIRQYNQDYGLKQQQQTFDQGIQTAGVTGTYNGSPTLQRQIEEGNLTGTYGGAPTVAEQQIGLDALKTAASLQGDPFAEQAYLHGLNGGGYSNAINAVAGRYDLPTFSMPTGTAPTNTMSLGNIAGQVANAQNNDDYTAALAALPSINQVNAREFNQLDPTSQTFILSGLQAKTGLDQGTIKQQINATLPGEAAGPKFSLASV